jgi:drug/metabolite transporter (DMT)-like permease
VTRSYVLLLTLLGLAWGSSYLFIKIGIRGFEPATMILIRVVLASALLAGLLAVRGRLGSLRRVPLGAFALGVVNAAIPFTLIAWGEKHVDSGTAAVINAGIPLFVALLAIRFARGERFTGTRLVGLLLGFGGVAWLVGLHPSRDAWYVAGAAAVLLATFSYAVATLAGQRLVARVDGPVLATACYVGASAVLLPVGVAQAPHAWPGWGPVAAVLALTLLGTVAAQLLWFRLLAAEGGARASLVSYLLPAVALVYGAVFLDEPLDAAKLGAFALILLGVVLAAGGARLPRRGAKAVEAG